MSLASVDWASKKIHEVARFYVVKIRDSDIPEPVRKEALGRIASIIKSIDKDLLFLNEARMHYGNFRMSGMNPRL